MPQFSYLSHLCSPLISAWGISLVQKITVDAILFKPCLGGKVGFRQVLEMVSTTIILMGAFITSACFTHQRKMRNGSVASLFMIWT